MMKRMFSVACLGDDGTVVQLSEFEGIDKAVAECRRLTNEDGRATAFVFEKFVPIGEAR